MPAQNYSYWLKSGIYSGLQKGAVLLFGIGSVLVLTRFLTKEQMGVWNLFLMITGIVEICRQSLIKNAVIKFINGHPADAHTHIEGAALGLNVAITLVVAVVLGVVSIPLATVLQAPYLDRVIWIFLPGLLLLIPFSHFEWMQNANADFKGIFWAYSCRQGMAFGLIVAHLVLWGPIGLTDLAIYFNLGIVAGTVAGWFFARKYVSGKVKFHAEWMGRLWQFGRFVFATNVSSSIFRNTDQFIVSSLISAPAVAMYGVCLRISNLVDMPSQVLGDILFPRSAKMMEGGNLAGVRFYYEKAVGCVLAIAVPASILIMLLPGLVIRVIAGNQYLEAATLLQLTILYGLFLPFIKQFGTIMDSIGKPKVNFYVITLTALLNIPVCYGCTKAFGLHGAAYGMMVSYFVCFLITQVYLNKTLGTSLLRTIGYAARFYPEMYQVLRHRFILKTGAE